MSFDNYTDLEVLDYLSMAAEMGLHLADFDDAYTTQDFVDTFMESYFRPKFLDIIRETTDFRQWPDRLNQELRLEYKGAMAEIQAILTMANDLDQGDPVPLSAAYVANNEYSHYCFLRLKKYVQEFYFSYLLDHDEVDFDDC